MTGRWSDVLTLEQLLYLTTLISVGFLLLNRILSCGRKRRRPQIHFWPSLARPAVVLPCTTASSVWRWCHTDHSRCQTCRWGRSGSVLLWSLWRSTLQMNGHTWLFMFSRTSERWSFVCLTVLQFLGELVVLQQSAHIAPYCPRHDGLHVGSLFTQPEVEISEPEDLIEAWGDVGCRNRKQCEAHRSSQVITGHSGFMLRFEDLHISER